MRPDVLAESLAAVVKALVEPLAARVAELEARAPVPGPVGGPGPPGRDGLDGKSWRDKLAALRRAGRRTTRAIS